MGILLDNIHEAIFYLLKEGYTLADWLVAYDVWAGHCSFASHVLRPVFIGRRLSHTYEVLEHPKLSKLRLSPSQHIWTRNLEKEYFFILRCSFPKLGHAFSRCVGMHAALESSRLCELHKCGMASRLRLGIRPCRIEVARQDLGILGSWKGCVHATHKGSQVQPLRSLVPGWSLNAFRV